MEKIFQTVNPVEFQCACEILDQQNIQYFCNTKSEFMTVEPIPVSEIYVEPKDLEIARRVIIDMQLSSMDYDVDGMQTEQKDEAYHRELENQDKRISDLSSEVDKELLIPIPGLLRRLFFRK